MKPDPPSFQEANRCDVCKCSFTTFRRRHHCRCCGKTLCNEHSSDQMPLPQFGIHCNVRVCSDCFNRYSKFTADSPGPSSQRVDSISEAVSRLDMNGDLEQNSGSASLPSPAATIPECKCGMPLCICEVSLPPTPAVPVQTVANSSSVLVAKSKKTEGTRQRRSSQDDRQGSSVSVGSSASGSDKPQANYEVNGEGLREAIKSGDLAGVKDLLDKGVDSNYCDKQGLSLLHLAAMFNQTDIVFTLMDRGARLDCKNYQGETPLDCAPVTLQYKMKKKIEDGFP